MCKKSIIVVSAICLIVAVLNAYYPMDGIRTGQKDGMPRGTKGEITDEPADWWQVAWTGVGELKEFTVSNTGQACYFSRPPDWLYWDGIYPVQTLDIPNGLTGEYPGGSKQYYIYACGLWVGGLYPIIQGEDTIEWQPRVATCAYYSDLGAMSVPEMSSIATMGDLSGLGLYFSTQRIPVGYGYGNEGEYLFAQPGRGKEDWQNYWPFADTASVNPRRNAAGFPELTLNPAKGDVVSMEDTYAVFGDWIPETEATTIWVMGYDIAGLGIRVEQRTYTWNYSYNNCYIYLNYKIRNMNPFRIEDLYVGFFMDNDVGESTDDMIGFDVDRNLGYTYDSDGQEEGWTTPAGCVGAVFCETPGNLGLTGFQTWLYGDLVDDPEHDHLKYKELTDTTYETFSEPRDVRQLSCSGPYVSLEPGEEVEVTIAIVAALTVSELQAYTDNAIDQFKKGYLGPQPPSSPAFTCIPGNREVYISWDNAPEYELDPAINEIDFEGYRVYRSRTGLSGAWQMLADYDLAASQLDNLVLVSYTKGSSTAEIAFEGFEDEGSSQFNERFKDAEYSIIFATDDVFSVYNVTKNEAYAYNSNALDDGTGFCIMDDIGATPYPTYPGYLSGRYIYMDGFYISITDGEPEPPRPEHPEAGDVFTVNTFKGGDIGAQTGIRHYYVDRDTILKNGITYYYAVTSYDRGNRIMNLPSLESAKSAEPTVPRSDPVDWDKPSADVEHTGPGSGEVSAEVMRISDVKDKTYRISFLSSDVLFKYAEYWRLSDLDENKILLDSIQCLRGEPNTPITDGILFRVNTPEKPEIDTLFWKSGEPSYTFVVDSSFLDTREPYDYEVTFGDSMQDCYPIPNWAPFQIKNVTLDTLCNILWKRNASDSIRDGDVITVLGQFNKRKTVMKLTFLLEDTLDIIYPSPSDTFRINFLKPLASSDYFTITTKSLAKREDFSLDNIKVIPNPYYVRAPWDKSRYDQKIYFENLPSECTIRIFTTSGLLIRTIEHSESIRGGGSEPWDLYTDEKMRIMSGLYIYQVKTMEGKTHIGKFAVIM